MYAISNQESKKSLYNNKLFCLQCDNVFISLLNKYLLNINTISVNCIQFSFSNYSYSNIYFESERNKISIKLPQIIFYNVNEYIINNIGNKEIDDLNQEQLIASDNDEINISFFTSDLVKILKCLELDSNKKLYLLFNFDNNTVKISANNYFLSTNFTNNTFLSNLINNQYNNYNFFDFCDIELFMRILEFSYIICRSNTYGRILNKATCFVKINEKFYCVNTNGRVLIVKNIIVKNNIPDKFSVVFTKNLHKFFIVNDQILQVKIYIDNNFCIFKYSDIIIACALISQEQNVNVLIDNVFERKIKINEQVLNNIFTFFNKIKSLTLDNTVILKKQENSNSITCNVQDSNSKFAIKIGVLDDNYFTEHFKIHLGFDVFELIKLVIKKIINEKNFQIDLLFNDSQINFASLNYNCKHLNDDVKIFFAVR